MDTSTFRLHQNFNPLYRIGDMYEKVGIIGHGAQNLNFFKRPVNKPFLFGAALYPYLANPDNTVFFNTRSPYTELIYSNTLGVDGKEETVHLMHTQNMDPFSNIGVEFELMSGTDLYPNEASRATRISLFGNRTKDKYSAFGTFHYNSFQNKENAGLYNLDGFLSRQATTLSSDTMNLENAYSGYKNLQLFYTQRYTLQEKITTTDTLGVSTTTGRNISVNHQLQAVRNMRFYGDEITAENLASVYNNSYYLNSTVKDSAVQDRISNTLQVILGDPYTDKLSARVFAGHEFVRYGQNSPEYYQYFSHFDTVSASPILLDSVFRDTTRAAFSNNFFNELFVGFHLAGPPENDWYWNIDAKYYLAGYYQNNFMIDATFSRALTDSLRLGLRGGIENRNVSYFHKQYSSAFFRWDNDFSSSQIIKGEAFLTSSERKFEASLTLGMLTNYQYWDEDALPAQYNPVMYIVSGVLNKNFTGGGFNSVNKLLIQYTTADDVLHLPLASLKTSNYWENTWFNDVLLTQLGFDLMITTPYLGNSYMPGTGVFYLQHEQTIGGYPFLDLFLSMRLKRARFFLSYNNVLSGLVSNNYFTLANYPMKPRYLGLGLGWTFYD
jgi:hypothetical protein